MCFSKQVSVHHLKNGICPSSWKFKEIFTKKKNLTKSFHLFLKAAIRMIFHSWQRNGKSSMNCYMILRLSPVKKLYHMRIKKNENSSMSCHMAFQGSFVGESYHTQKQIAYFQYVLSESFVKSLWIWGLFCMRKKMNFQAGFIGKCFVTYFTSIWYLPQSKLSWLFKLFLLEKELEHKWGLTSMRFLIQY